MDDSRQPSPLLEALRRIAENPYSYSQDLDEAGEEFRAALVESVRQDSASRKKHLLKIRQAGQSVLRALRPPKSDQEALTRLKETIGLTGRQLRNARAIRLLNTGTDGRLQLADESAVVLSPDRAVAYLAVLGCLVGLAIGSVIAEPRPGLWLVIRSTGLGMAIGSIAGLVLDRSFRVYVVVAELKAAEPWLTASQARSGI